MELRPILTTLRRHKTASALIVLEIALSCAIICNALFLISGRIDRLGRISGLAENELVRVQLTGIGKDDNDVALTTSDLAALRALPGVRDAIVTNQVPFVNSSWNSSVNMTKDQQQPTLSATTYMADEHFLDTFGLKLIAGRNFTSDELVDWATFNAPNSKVSLPSVIITKSMADWKIPGLALAIVRNDSVILAKGYGVRTLGKPDRVDERTLFAIGSSSKAFTSLAVAMLVDQGKVKWDDPATKYLPGFQLYDPYVTREITVRDLLSHRSGLARGDMLWYAQDLPRDSILALGCCE